MKIVKKKLDDMYRCYCASNIYFDGQNHILLASEDPNVACNMYYGKDYETKENVWTHPGGCMSIVPIPGKEKEFLWPLAIEKINGVGKQTEIQLKNLGFYKIEDIANTKQEYLEKHLGKWGESLWKKDDGKV